jgi:signal transduction histidine kinase
VNPAVALPATLTAVLQRVRHPRTTVRGRLALLYGSLFLASGVALLAITYVLVDNTIRWLVNLNLSPVGKLNSVQVGKLGASSSNNSKPGVLPHKVSQTQVIQLEEAENHLVLAQHTADLHSLLLGSSIALGVMIVASVLLGWLVAGRILRPLRTITNAARHISEVSLDRRLALEGPPDELKHLGDTIDGLLGRLQAAFEAQRHFVANAAHELRAPLTVERAMLQVALADPGLTLDALRAACEDVIENGRQQEKLLEALLTLARSQRGLDHKEALDLAAIAGDMAGSRKQQVTAAGLQLDLALRPALVSGDPQLVERLVANLLDNALRYNRAGGSVRMATEDNVDGARLIVTNTGPVVPEDQIARLLEPFQRIAPSRTGQHEGLGLGLSIVQAIARAHGAHLDVNAGAEGGLTVEIRFPARPAPSDGHARGDATRVTGRPAAAAIRIGRGASAVSRRVPRPG